MEFNNNRNVCNTSSYCFYYLNRVKLLSMLQDYYYTVLFCKFSNKNA